jgi:hypothetical protein
MFSKSHLDRILPSFKNYLDDKSCREDYLIFEIVKSFTTNWNLDQLDVYTMLDKSLQSSISNRLWSSTAYIPKEMILEFANADKETIRMMFYDLYDESKAIEGRIGRFIFHCDEILSNLRSKSSSKRFSTHYHDHQVISLYLYLGFPEKYTFYDESKFKLTMKNLNARNIPEVIPIESYHKISSILSKFIYQNQDLLNLVKAKLSERKISFLPTNGIANIFFEFIYLTKS